MTENAYLVGLRLAGKKVVPPGVLAGVINACSDSIGGRSAADFPRIRMAVGEIPNVVRR